MASRFVACATLDPKCSVASNNNGLICATSVNTSCFSRTSQLPDPLLSTQTLPPGSISLAYGKLIMSLACATRIVCKVNPSPVPFATTRSPANWNTIFAVVRLGTPTTSYTPLTSTSKNLIIRVSPTTRPCC